MKIEDLNPFVRYASMHRDYYKQKERSVCYDCRLFYIERGKGVLSVDGQKYQVLDNIAVFLPPKSRYKFVFEDDKDIKIFVINFDLISEYSYLSKSLGTATESTFIFGKVPLYDLPEEFSLPIIKENCVSIYNYISDSAKLFLQKVAYYKHYASAYIKLALIELLLERNNEKSDYKLIQSVQEFIRANYSIADLSNGDIAKRFNYHPYHLNRLMKKYTGKTLRDYLIYYRLHMAKHYLLTTTLNVTAVAEKTGFTSYTYFIKIFRERAGISPLQYRKNNKNAGL